MSQNHEFVTISQNVFFPVKNFSHNFIDSRNSCPQMTQIGMDTLMENVNNLGHLQYIDIEI